MSAHWHTSQDEAAAADACARHVITVLDEALSGRQFATFAISGGSTPRLMFGTLARTRFPWDRVHLFWVDERSVPPGDPASNFKLADETLIQPAHIPATHVHRIVGEIAPKTAAVRYAAEIREFFGLAAGELPQFDLVHRGMGPDGHTASLFPGSPLISDHQGIADAVFAPQFNQWRVTLLPGALMAAKRTVFLVAGADKAEVLRAVFQEPYDPSRYPAQIASQGQGVAWFLDAPAAALIS